MQNDPIKNNLEEDDDLPVGRILSRREVLALLGGGAAVLVGGLQALAADTVYLPIVANGATVTLLPTAPAATTTPTATATSNAAATVTPTAIPTATAVCVVRPEMTVGPYFVDEKLNRSDIRSDPSNNTVKSGAELQLTLRVYTVSNNSCTPLVGAFVDIWHCDAAGLYSDVSQEGTSGQKFLRGYQITDANGVATFITLYPGWYTGRAVHIHFKIRDALTTNPTNYHFISQFFFNEDMTTLVHAQSPYASKGTRNTLNSTDNIYTNNGGSQMLLPVVQNGSVYTATFDIGFAI